MQADGAGQSAGEPDDSQHPSRLQPRQRMPPNPSFNPLAPQSVTARTLVTFGNYVR